MTYILGWPCGTDLGVTGDFTDDLIDRLDAELFGEATDDEA